MESGTPTLGSLETSTTPIGHVLALVEREGLEVVWVLDILHRQYP